MTIFKDIHPALSLYMFVAIIVCATFGAYNQWAACAMVVSGFFPSVPIEVGGALAALAGLMFLVLGAYKRLEIAFAMGLGVLILCFSGSAFMTGIDAREAAAGLIPQAPGEGAAPARRRACNTVARARTRAPDCNGV